MSRWSDSFDSHQIHETIKSLEDWMEVEGIDLDAEHKEERRRFNKILKLIKSIVDGQDPDTASYSLISNLNNQLRQAQIWNQIQSYSTSRKIGNLRNANEHVNELLPQIYQIAPVSFSPDAAKIIRDIEKNYSDFCWDIDNKVHEFQHRVRQAEESLIGFEKGLSELRVLFEELSNDAESALNGWALLRKWLRGIHLANPAW